MPDPAFSPGAAAAQLDLKVVGNIRGAFRIGRYQRGYRWGPDEVERLLDDIWENGDRPYCLQPVVVKGNEEGPWELVDGQQRLTTLYLVFKYMQDAELHSQGPLYSILYETRLDRGDYLTTLDPRAREDNIDFHHIYGAYECIQRWFHRDDRNPHLVATELYLHLMKRVQIIWYKAPAELDSVTLFTRLNVGRIPLTDAELVKAELLGSAKAGRSDRSLEIAAQWDAIERDLHDPDVWAFVTRDRPQDAPTRISLLLDTLAGGEQGRMRPRFHTFVELQKRIRNGSTEDEWKGKSVWDDVVDLHAMVLGWFGDRHLYHKVGFLIAVGARFEDVVEKADGLTRTAFQELLDGEIRSALNLTRSRLLELRYHQSGHTDKLNEVLLLMNAESVRRVETSSERYPFRLHHGQVQWSLEHIHAQNPEGLNKAEQWATWLAEHRKALLDLPVDDSPRRDALVQRIDACKDDLTRSKFEALAEEVSAFFRPAEEVDDADLHGLNNLALLSQRDNSRLNNAVFEVKRRRILELDRDGAYIPPCTRHVFLKYYTDADGQQIHYWSQRDRQGYLEAMLDPARGVLTPYLMPDEDAP